MIFLGPTWRTIFNTPEAISCTDQYRIVVWSSNRISHLWCFIEHFPAALRLLDTSTIELHEFHSHETPPYAILSHTWGENEISYQDIMKLKYKKSAGYEKVVRCCKLAASHDLGYVWIDTCCIDKTSSAELSEAINSMCSWYGDAKVCYVYLVDVCLGRPYNPQSDEEIFCHSRWFSRGWTLQELLAPRQLIFYGQDWLRIGDYSSLTSEISWATGIQRYHLEWPAQASVAAKMPWASKRQVTRIEDIAYSLLGLFGVNMPLLYGEGRQAFMRLQHEIVKEIDDESIFAWRDTSLDSSGMFALSPAAFADCGDIVTHDYLYFRRRDPSIVTNRGLSIELVGSIDEAGNLSLET